MRIGREHGSNREEESDGPGWRHSKEEPHELLFAYVSRMEMDNAHHYDKMFKMEYLYDPTNPRFSGGDELGLVNENVVAANADTIVASMVTSDIRVRVLTDGGTWSEQRIAKRLELYYEGVDKLLGPVNVGEETKWSFLKGASLTWVGIEFGSIVRRHVPLDEIYYDPFDVDDSKSPNQLHWLTLISKDRLVAMHPKREKEIREQGCVSATSRYIGLSARAKAGMLGNSQIAFLRSWAPAVGVKGKRGYIPGRYTECIEGATLCDDVMAESWYPFAKLSWSARERDWFPISGAERIAGIQRALNRRNWQIEASLDRAVAPTTYVGQADAKISVKTHSKYASIGVYKDKPPVTVEHRAVNAETYQSRVDLKNSAFEETGTSRLAAQSMKPAGIDSGVGLREYRDQTTVRFSQQEKNAEQYKVDIAQLTIWRCKQLGARAPRVPNKRRFGKWRNAQIKWSDVDLGDLTTQLSAASTLPRTAAGRQQLVLEWAQAGLIPAEEATRMLHHPDIERFVSLFMAALESVEHEIEAIGDGEYRVPEPFMNLNLCVKKGTQQYLAWKAEADAAGEDDGPPEEVLENLRDFITMAAYMLTQQQAGAAASAGGAASLPSLADPAAMQQPPTEAMTGLMPAMPAA